MTVEELLDELEKLVFNKTGGYMVDDYSVTWDDVKMRLENELQRRGISGADKIPMGVIEVALKKVWNDLCYELNGFFIGGFNK